MRLAAGNRAWYTGVVDPPPAANMPALPPGPKLDVICSDGQVFAVTGRAARLILWIARHAARIEAQARGELVFGFRETQMTCRLAEMWDSVEGA